MGSSFDRRTLFFVWLPGCAACEAAEPDLLKFQRKNPDEWVIRLNAAAPNPHPIAQQAKSTPTYVLTENGVVERVKVGRMSTAELEKWIR